MLSILIPTYDYTCYQLVHDLHEQAERLGVPYEIIVAEDGSRSQVNIIANHKIADLSHCRHHVRKHNLGLAATRNELAEMAQYDWLLLIDSDAKVEKPDFLYTYLNHTEKAEVVVGGLYHQAINHDPNKSLRFKYEKEADKHRLAAERSQHPYQHLSCFNIMLHKPTFMQILFDKDCKEYGYEDALFGVELQKRGIPILHIDNPLMHTGLDTNERFLQKSETALRTLKKLNGKMESHSHVGKALQRLQKNHIAWVMRLFFKAFKPLMRHNLLSKNPSLFWFSVYKLGYYSTL
ncbi:MAG: glycosyltransferase [Bacteroidaceae bacterium]|nr:glycosyltransferase [Bacteroidaceae bacterium]